MIRESDILFFGHPVYQQDCHAWHADDRYIAFAGTRRRQFLDFTVQTPSLKSEKNWLNDELLIDYQQFFIARPFPVYYGLIINQSRCTALCPTHVIYHMQHDMQTGGLASTADLHGDVRVTMWACVACELWCNSGM